MSTADDETALKERVAKLLPTLEDAPIDFAATIRHDPADAASDTTTDKTTARAELPRISLGMGSIVPPAANTDFSVVSTIGEGGLGRVHLAWQRSLARDVAVKTLKDQSNVEVGMELLREARLTGSLEHPGVIPIHALGSDEVGTPLLVMKRVEGVDFADLLALPDHPIWAERISATVDRLAAKLEIIVQVCRTLEFAHARGVIHRDIKPANIMVGRFGEVYLLDWGIAFKKGDARGRGIVGTPGFMAPEMFVGEAIDERTDVYLLGAMLHFVLTGTLRHVGADLLAIGKTSILSEPVAYDSDVPKLLADICNRATARNRDERPQSAQEFRELVTEFLQHRSAMVLSAAARERLTELTALLAAADAGKPPKDLAAAYRLATEARFGFTQCLKEHRAHADAILGAREAVVALVDLELRQGHADSADAILRELDTKDEKLAARVADAQRADEARRVEAARLEALDRDRNPNIGLAPRAAAFAVGALTVVGIAALASRSKHDAWSEVGITTVAIAINVGVSILFRRWLFRTTYSKSVVGLFYVFLLLWLVDKVACAMTGGDANATFATDLWIAAASLAAGALSVDKKLGAGVLPLVVGAIALRVRPDLTQQIFPVAMFLAIGLAGALLFRARRA